MPFTLLGWGGALYREMATRFGESGMGLRFVGRSGINCRPLWRTETQKVEVERDDDCRYYAIPHKEGMYTVYPK